MQTIWNKTKDIASYAAEKIGLRANYLSEIREKRECMRKLKEQYGVDVFEALMNNDKERAHWLFENLKRSIQELNLQIHLLEAKMLDHDDTQGLKSTVHPVDVTLELPNQEKEQELLQWCQKILANFKGVEIKDFSTSWNNGFAFAALLVNWRPDLFDTQMLHLDDSVLTLKNVFTEAEKVGIPIILNYEFMQEADSKSIMTQVNLFKHKFENQSAIPDVELVKQWNLCISELVEQSSGKGNKGLLTKAKELVIGTPDTHMSAGDKGILTKAKDYVLGGGEGKKEDLELLSSETTTQPQRPGLLQKAKDFVLHHELKDMPNDRVRSNEGPAVNILEHGDQVVKPPNLDRVPTDQELAATTGGIDVDPSNKPPASYQKSGTHPASFQTKPTNPVV